MDKMNILPKEIEDIIIYYKDQLELCKKQKKINEEIKNMLKDVACNKAYNNINISWLKRVGVMKDEFFINYKFIIQNIELCKKCGNYFILFPEDTYASKKVWCKCNKN